MTTDVYANDPEKQAELDLLRGQADAMGINYHHRAGIPKLKALIAEGQAMPGEAAETVMTDEQFQEKKQFIPGVDFMTEEQFQQQFGLTPQQEANKLIRCRVTCMNPLKREWRGEILTVMTSKLGTFKKFIPFDGQPYHIPQIIFDFMKERECTTFISVKDKRGNETRKAKMMKEFSLDKLEPMTNQELKELAQRQAMAEGSAEAVR